MAELVVAHYMGGLDWLMQVQALFERITIYTKGSGPVPIPPAVKCPVDIVALPNLGRESHTYLEHIVRRYDSLPGRTVFVQDGYDDKHTGPHTTTW